MKKKIVGLLIAIATWVPDSNIVRAQDTEIDVDQSKAQYTEIMKRLDPGGDLLLVANLDGILEETVDQVVQMLDLATGSMNNGTANRISAELPTFLREKGFYAARGYGLSIVPREDGLHDVKTFLSRDPSAAALPLWRGTVGGAQREMTVVHLLPSDTVMARTSTAELRWIWEMINDGVHELASPEVVVAFDAAVNGMEAQWGVALEDVIASLGEESMFSIQLSRTQTLKLPAGANTADMPAPSFLLGVQVENDALPRMLEAALAGKGLPLTKSNVGETECTMLNLPLPLPFTFLPTYALCEGFFVLGSNPDVVTAAVTAFRERSGLTADAEFKQAFDGLPMKNNGLVYLHPRLMETMADVQGRMMSVAPGANPDLTRSMLDLAYRRRAQSAAAVCLNWKSGVLTTGRSSSGGKDVVAGMLMMPVGMMAGIAIPSFVKARSTSQQNACINNLRQLDSAKEQWALANRKSDGDAVDVQGVLAYVRGAQMPVCPAGGTYRLNVIGESPECTVAGHMLPQP